MTSIHEVRLEVLRHGPPHNQLLSPLTPYMALSGRHESTTVHVPFDHRVFLAYTNFFRYRHGSFEDRELQLGRISDELSGIFRSVPGLLADIAQAKLDGDFIQLKIISSASELALLPFELLMAPPGFPGEGASLSLQLESPLVMTREIRSAYGKYRPWPTKPRVLFAAARPPGVEPIPIEAHLQALTEALAPWGTPSDPELFTFLPAASLSQIRETCGRNLYTHVHLLAHSHEIKRASQPQFALVLHDEMGDADYVDGERLETALRTHLYTNREKTQMSHPAVVSLATCDSANQSQVIVPGTSIAHGLHEAGIPLVVASQFPLSAGGSVVMTQALYNGLMRGDDPRKVLHDVRMKLREQDKDTHDWASMVAYASLPDNLESQVSYTAYESLKSETNRILERFDNDIASIKKESDKKRIAEIKQKFERCRDRIEIVSQRMPQTGDFDTEGQGVVASAYKRIAESSFLLAVTLKEEKDNARYIAHSLEAVKKSCEYYEKAIIQNLKSPAGPRRLLHWVMTQYLSISTILGNKLNLEWWMMAEISANIETKSATGQDLAWAHGTLAELHLLRIVDPADNKEASFHENKAREHISTLKSTVQADDFAIASTRRQFNRYIEWWGAPEFENHLFMDTEYKRPKAWTALIETAENIVESLGGDTR